MPAEITAMMGKVYAPILKDVDSIERAAKAAELTRRIEILDTSFSGLILSVQHGNIFEGNFLLKWANKVRILYQDFPEMAYKAMYVMLEHHIPKKEDLTSVLLARAMNKKNERHCCEIAGCSGRGVGRKQSRFGSGFQDF